MKPITAKCGRCKGSGKIRQNVLEETLAGVIKLTRATAAEAAHFYGIEETAMANRLEALRGKGLLSRSRPRRGSPWIYVPTKKGLAQ